MTDFLSEIAAILSDWRILATAVITAVAGLMRGYSGFGTAILLAPAYSTLWGPRIGIPVMLMMELFVSMQLLPKAFGQADRRVMLPIGAAAVCFAPFGAWILLTADQETLRRGIGLLVLVFGFALMSGWRYHGSRPLPLNLAVGTVAGLLKGATGVSGPPVILYLLAGAEEAKRHRANLILFFACIAVVSVIPPLWAGLIGWRELAMLALLLPILLGCVPIGARLFHVIPERWCRRFAFGLLVTTGVVALLV